MSNINDVTKIDKNLVGSDQKIATSKTYNLPCAPFRVYGLMHKEGVGFFRMPREIADNVNDGVKTLNYHTAGGRVLFKTDATEIRVSTTCPIYRPMSHMNLIAQSGFSLDIKEGNTVRFVNSMRPRSDRLYDWSATVRLDGKMHEYVLSLPLYNAVSRLSIELPADATVLPPEGYAYDKPIVFYGNSVTQGGCANRSDNDFVSLLSTWLDVDVVNLGFSGSGCGEPIIADYLATLDPLIFFMDYDHNAPSVEHLRKTHLPMYRKFREKHPTTPIVMSSRYGTEANYSSSDNNAKARFAVIRATYRYAVANGDKHVYLVNGQSVFPKGMQDKCTVDHSHPSDLGFYFIAKKLYPVLKKALDEME